jgi:signal transduction histidine kinase
MHAHHRNHPRRPTSLLLRVFAVLLIGLALAAAISGGFAWWTASARRGEVPSEPQPWAEHVAAFIAALDAPNARTSMLLDLGEAAGIRALPRPSQTPQHGGMMFEPSRMEPAPEWSAALSAQLGRPASVSASGIVRCARPPSAPWIPEFIGRRHPDARHCRLVRTTLADGAPLALAVPDTLGSAPPPREPPRTRFYPLAFLLLLLLLAAAITRLVMRPMVQLERAAQRFADDVHAPPLRERGPREIRAALAAFNRMQSRIRAHIAERTSMLAAIAHDLQTPLTRLRLRLEQVSDAALRERLVHDLDDCRARVAEGLDLARSLDDRSPLVPVDLDALLQSACDEAVDAGQPVQYESRSALTVRARPAALLRCVENLIANAVKYGETAKVSARADGANAIIAVRDHGPGIPAADMERVFEPFVRLEDSRSRATGGSGLGLTIVRNLMAKQNGRVELHNAAQGEPAGLEARLIIPLA